MSNDIAESDPFDGFESTAEVVAFVRHKHGEAGVRELLAMMNEPVPDRPWLLPQRLRITKEALERTARELESRGLKKLSKIVRQHAKSRPSELDVPPYPPGSIDHRAWLAGMKRRKKRETSE